MCVRCGKREGQIVMKSDSPFTEHMCFHCHNELMSEEINANLESQPESISIQDSQGISRHFKIVQRLLPMGIFIEAEETIECGYKFVVHGELDCDQSKLFQKLIEKIKQGVAVKHVKTESFPNGQVLNSFIKKEIVGRIEYDENREVMPLVIIDGKPYTWDQLGEMMMSIEGFQVQLKIFDITDDVE